MSKYQPILGRERLLALKQLILDIEHEGDDLVYSDVDRINRLAYYIHEKKVELVEVSFSQKHLQLELAALQSQLGGIAARNQLSGEKLDPAQKAHVSQLNDGIAKYMAFLQSMREGKNVFPASAVAKIDSKVFARIKIKVSPAMLKNLKNELNEYTQAFKKGQLFNPYNKAEALISYNTQKGIVLVLMQKNLAQQSRANLTLDEKEFLAKERRYLFLPTLLALESEGFIKITDLGFLSDSLEEHLRTLRVVGSSTIHDWMWVRMEVLKAFDGYFSKIEKMADKQVEHLMKQVEQKEAEHKKINPAGSENEVVYEVKYTDDGIFVNNFFLSSPDFMGGPDEIFRVFYTHPKQTVVIDDHPEEKKKMRKRPLSNIISDLGFKGDFRKMFFPKLSKTGGVFFNPITRKDLKERDLSLLMFDRKHNAIDDESKIEKVVKKTMAKMPRQPAVWG